MTAVAGPAPMGLFGGTFDPIHYGHLRTAFEVLEALQLTEMRFLVAGEPPHRDSTHADAEARAALVRAAIADEPRFQVDEREMRREGPSYSVDTLAELRGEHPRRTVCLVLGMDAFLGLPRWHRWRDILGLAHVVVAHRPGWQAPQSGPLGELLARHRVADPLELHHAPAGRIHVRPVTQLEISSSAIRALVRAGKTPRYLVPDAVCRLLADSGCYLAAAEGNR
jgi:nicotinate-nucleotide adenylyltransferase